MSARTALVSTVVTYNLRVWLAGLAAAVLVPLSAVALVLDLLTGKIEDGLTQRVLAASARLEATIDIHGDLTEVRVTDRREAEGGGADLRPAHARLTPRPQVAA